MCTYKIISGVCRVADDVVVDPSVVNGAGILVIRNSDLDGKPSQKAVSELKSAGIACVIASKFTRNIFRSMINGGIAPVVYDRIGSISDGDAIEINLAEGKLTHGETVAEIPPLPDFMRKILSAGGLSAYTRQEIAEK